MNQLGLPPLIISLPTLDEWDEFGSRQRIFDRPTPPPPRSLLPLRAPVLPAPTLTGRHFYRNAIGELCSTPYSVGQYECLDMNDADDLLSNGTDGVPYLYAVWIDNTVHRSATSRLILRAAFVDIAGPHDSVLKPMPVGELLQQMARNAPDAGRFPHRCPRCNSPAFIGFNLIECTGGCR